MRLFLVAGVAFCFQALRFGLCWLRVNTLYFVVTMWSVKFFVWRNSKRFSSLLLGGVLSGWEARFVFCNHLYG